MKRSTAVEASASRPHRRVRIMAAALLPVIAVASACSSSKSSSPTSSAGGQGTTATAAGQPTTATAPAGVDAQAAALVPADVKNRTLNVAIYNDYPPAEFIQNGKLVGYSPDVAQAIGIVLGLKLNIQGTAFESIIPGLVDKRFDMGVTTFNITPERQKVLDFVTYLRSGTGFLLAASSPHQINGPTDLCGLRAAVITGSAQQQDVQQFSSACTAAGKQAIAIQTYPASSNAALAVQSGRADVDVADQDTLEYVKTQAGGVFKLAPFVYQPTPLAIGIAKGYALGPALVAAINVIIANGEYGRIMSKWGAATEEIPRAELIR